MRLTLAVLPLTLAMAASASAQSIALSTLAPPERHDRYRLDLEKGVRFASPESGFNVPDMLQPNVIQKNRGIVAGVGVAPDTVIGVGIFEMTPKKQSMAGPTRLDEPAKRTRKAAIGLKFKF